MITPTSQTDAAPPERGCRGVIVLAGAIKWWWLSRCANMACEHIEERTPVSFCSQCGRAGYYEFWNSPQHRAYVEWRNEVRRKLIEAGWLTYAPHEAFKGTWDEKAQAINDAAIAAADLVLVLSPTGAITEGTDSEVEYAQRVKTRVMYAPLGTDLDKLGLI